MAKSPSLLTLLEDLAGSLSIEIRTAPLGVPTPPQDAAIAVRSGLCVINGKRVVFIEKHLPREEKMRVLGRELARLDLSHVFIAPLVREYLETCRSP